MWDSLWMVLPLGSALNFVFVTHFMGIFFHLLRRIEVLTLWSSFFLSFICFANTHNYHYRKNDMPYDSVYYRNIHSNYPRESPKISSDG
jgi:hypothetical protein